MQVIKRGDTKVITKDGECAISLTIDLNINLTTEGIQIGVKNVKSSSEEKQPVKSNKEDFDWAIPDFKANKIDFGSTTKG